MVQTPRPSTLFFRISLLPSDLGLSVSISLIPLLLGFMIFVGLVFVFPASVAAASSSTGVGSEPTREGLTHGELGMIAAVALLFASLGLLKDFHRYRGLLHVLVWNFYSWLFLAFTTTCIFAVDYVALQQLQNVIHTELMRHISLALGHTSVSAAFAYASPIILRVIPMQSQATPEPSPKKPEK